MDISSRGSCVLYIYIYNAYVLLSFLVFHFTMKQGKVCPELAAVCGLTWGNSDPELWLSLVIWSASPLCDFFETETQGPLLYKERWTTKKRICPPELQKLSLLGSACCGGYMRKSDHWEPWGPQDPKTPPSYSSQVSAELCVEYPGQMDCAHAQSPSTLVHGNANLRSAHA